MTTFIPREDLVPLDFEDRRRLVVSEVVMIVEKNEVITPAEIGPVVLRNVASEDEIFPMGDKAAHRLHQIFGQ